MVGYVGILTNEGGIPVKEYFGKLWGTDSPFEADVCTVYIGLLITLKPCCFNQTEFETDSDIVVKLFEDEQYAETIIQQIEDQCDKDYLKYLMGQCTLLVKGYGVQVKQVGGEVVLAAARLAQNGTTQIKIWLF